jgi:hypothetical protein
MAIEDAAPAPAINPVSVPASDAPNMQPIVIPRPAAHRAAVEPLVAWSCDCPTGKSAIWLSSPITKNIRLYLFPKSSLYPRPSHPTEGRIMIVTYAGWDAVDAAASGA